MSITEEINHKTQPNLPSLSTHHTDFYVIFFFIIFSLKLGNTKYIFGTRKRAHTSE